MLPWPLFTLFGFNCDDDFIVISANLYFVKFKCNFHTGIGANM